MIKLSIEQKAKAYDERLEKAQKWYDINTNEGYRSIFEDIFPELKESEDERIRKELIEFFTFEHWDGEAPFSVESARERIAWIKKQGEQKPVVDDKDAEKASEEYRNFRMSCGIKDPVMLNEIEEAYYEGAIRKQKPADKVEPKFKIGDWVTINPELRFAPPICIKDIDNNNYRVESVNGNSGAFTIDYLDNHYHLWTIQDAKDGDVLATLDYILVFKEFLKNDGGISYCHYDFGAGNPQFIWLEDKNWYFGKEAIIHPATKEQRDLLFQKMKEAGYEWDVEKKELKKIEQKPAGNSGKKSEDVIEEKDMTEYKKGFECGKQYVLKYPEEYNLCKKIAWNEEDDSILKEIIDSVTACDATTGTISVCFEKHEAKVRWLKSLKERFNK